jgi:hypothetical protein
MKKTRLVLFGWLLLAVATAQAQFTFTTNNGSITITGYRGSSLTAVIPAATNGRPVTTIGANAFYYENITNVTLPNSITNIGNGAFNACNSLGSVTIPGSVLSIGDLAFASCGKLTNLTISAGVASIGNGTFESCSKLSIITIPGTVTSLGSQAFYNCPNLGTAYFTGNPPAADVSVFSGDQQANIYYFPGATGWTSPFGGIPAMLFPFTYSTNAGGLTITGYAGAGAAPIPAADTNGWPFTSLTATAFAGNSSVTNITMPNTLTNIPAGAFFNCPKLTAINVNNPFYSSVSGVLFNQHQTTLIQYPGGLTGNYNIPYSVTNVAPGAFTLANLSTVTIPPTVTSIGAGAFADCTNLTWITVTSGNPDYSSVFGVLFNQSQTVLLQCPGAYGQTLGQAWHGNYYITGPVTNVAPGAFAGCQYLTTISISNTVTSVGTGAFQNCPALTNVTLLNNATNLGAFAFAGCPALNGVYFTGNTPVADPTIFAGDTNATAYYLPGTSGWGAAFAGVPAVLWLPYSYTTNAGALTLTGYTGPGGAAVVLPATINGLPVTCIGSNAFTYANFTAVTIPDSVNNIQSFAFEFSPTLTSITIGGSVTNIGEYAFANCAGLTSVAIPGSVLSLGQMAFQSCYGLTNVTLGNGVVSIGNNAFASGDLTSVTIPATVTYLGDNAFSENTGLSGVYFLGKAPVGNVVFFSGDNRVTLYHLPNTGGWSTSFPGTPSALWLPQIQAGGNGFGLQNGQFGFNLTWAAGQSVTVQACTNLANPVWTPVQSVLLTNGSYYFSEPLQTNGPGRYYLLTSP